jgi:hypothetical protein
MKQIKLVTGILALGFVVGCTNANDKVADERKDLQKTEQKATDNVRDAQAKAVKDINDKKESAAKDINKQENKLEKAEQKADEANGTASGTTTSEHDVTVTADECVRLAKEKSVKPADQARYNACSKMNKDKIR